MWTSWLGVLSLFLFAVSILATDLSVNSYDPEYGVYLRDLDQEEDGGVALKGKVFLVNESTIQVINCTYTPNTDSFFWIDIAEALSSNGSKLSTFEFGVTPLGPLEETERIVLHLPPQKKITDFKSFGIYSPKEKLVVASISIPSDVIVPKSQFLSKELSGSRYSVGSGPILIQDRRTVKIFAFTFDADKAPDGYFFVGRGVNVVYDAGVKVPIRGRDDPNNVTPMQQRYRGGEDIILELPKDYDINHIDWLSVYCYKFRVDFGHVSISELGQYIPPYVPLPISNKESNGLWKAQPLLGTSTRTNFILQLGPPGGKKGYEGINGLKPGDHVWYVNGYLATLYLKRGFNYSFTVEGGRNNSFYISDDPFGGLAKLDEDEQKAVRVFAPARDDIEDSGKTCIWSGSSSDPDSFESFYEFRKTLRLDCLSKESSANIVHFRPDKSTPDVVYGNSYNNYYMGFTINVVDVLPTDIADIEEAPFESDAWTNRTSSAPALVPTVLLMLSMVLLWT